HYFDSQPWPFLGGQLMIGCYAYATDETITLHDSELEDCRWFSRSEIADMIQRSRNINLDQNDRNLRIPPPIAIAHQLIYNCFNDSRIGFACLPLNHVNQGESYPPIGKETWVVGWGTTQFGGKVSPTLLQVSVPITNNQGCKQVLSAPAKQICAGYDQGGKDSCQGDSGGPLVVEIGQGIFELIGLVSFGIGCAKAMKPGVYTRVAGYIDWINDVLKSTSSNSNPNPNSTYPKTTSAKPTYPEPTHPISKPLALSNTISNYQKLSYLIISIEILLLI
ncbi:unnamed protein product, partial [Rotaria magnacalcarata]